MGNPSESGAAGDVKSSRSAASTKSGKIDNQLLAFFGEKLEFSKNPDFDGNIVVDWAKLHFYNEEDHVKVHPKTETAR